MTAEDVAAEPPAQPSHPLPALTTFELRDYRSDLEHALKTLPGHVAVRALLQQRLTEVLTEQQSRTRLRQANGS